MASTGGKHDHVTGGESKLVTAGPAENYARVPGCNAQNFVCCGVIVVKIVDAVPPLRWPAVANKTLFEIQSRIGTGNVEHSVVKKDGKTVVVRNPGVARELNDFRLLG